MTQVPFPVVTTTISGAITNVANIPQKILVVSQLTTAGTAVAGDLNENIGANADTLAGITSLGAEIVRAVRRVNSDTQLDAIFLDEAGGGVAATGIVNFTGSTATEAGSLTVIIGSERNHSLSVAIASGDNATAIGDTLVAAIVADTTILVSSVNTTGSVALTATNKGEVGNEIAIEVRGAVAGVTVALTTMASGATDPVFTGVFDVIDGERYQTILWSWSSDVAPLTTLVDGRINSTNAVLDGLGYVGKMDTLSNHTTTIGALNSVIVYIAEKTEATTTLKGPAAVELPAVIATYCGALRALKLTDGAAIADINAGTSGTDGNGGPALASRPLANTPIYVMAPFKKGRGWSQSDVDALNLVGGTVITNNSKANQIALGEQFTTRLTTGGGSPDDTFKFVSFYDTSMGIREYFDSNLRSRYGQTRLTAGDIVPGRPMVNVEQFTASILEFFTTLGGPDFALARAGEDNLSFVKDPLNLIVSFNLQAGSITWSVKIPIVTQVRSISGAVEIVLAIVAGVIGEDEEEEENEEDPEEL